MSTNTSFPTKVSDFFVIGVSHKEADVLVRERFSLSNEKQVSLYSEATKLGLTEIMLISTCNRVEVYGFGNSINLCTHLLIKYSQGSMEELEQFGFLKKGKKAIEHLFRVTAGLESKILGDYQITGQVRDAFKLALDQGCLGSRLSKMIEKSLGTAKKIKNSSNLSSGATSVATVASKIVVKRSKQKPGCKILIYGLGQTGKACLLNLLGKDLATQLSLINRNNAKSEKYALDHKTKSYNHEELSKAVAKSDIVIVATSSGKYIISEAMLEGLPSCPSLFVDLSVPRNVDPKIETEGNAEIIDIDHISEILDETFEERKKAKDTAKSIIHKAIEEYILLAELFYESSTVEALRNELNSISNSCRNALKSEDMDTYSQAFINTLVRRIAAYCRKNPDSRMKATELIEELFQLETKSEETA